MIKTKAEMLEKMKLMQDPSLRFSEDNEYYNLDSSSVFAVIYDKENLLDSFEISGVKLSNKKMRHWDSSVVSAELKRYDSAREKYINKIQRWYKENKELLTEPEKVY